MSYIIWGIATFFTVIKLNKNEGTEYSPWPYVLGTLALGYIFSMGMFCGRMYKDKGNKNASIVSYVIAGIMVVINVGVLLSSL